MWFFEAVMTFLEVVSGFHDDDNDELAIERNIQNWGRFGKLLCREGAKPETWPISIWPSFRRYSCTELTPV
jgi:hypothetical protein